MMTLLGREWGWHHSRSEQAGYCERSKLIIRDEIPHVRLFVMTSASRTSRISENLQHRSQPFPSPCRTARRVCHFAMVTLTKLANNEVNVIDYAPSRLDPFVY